MNVTINSKVCWSNEQLSTEIDDRGVLMSVSKGKYYDLDPVSTDIWRRLAEPVLVAQLCKSLSQEYNADVAAIERDVMPWLEQLHAENLIMVME